MKKQLSFFQFGLRLDFSVALKSKKRLRKSFSNDCRALLNNRLMAGLKAALSDARLRPVHSWNIPAPIRTTPKATDQILFGNKRNSVTLRVSAGRIRPVAVRRGNPRDPWNTRDGITFLRNDGRAVTRRNMQDFYYLADLLCGTFAVLWSPQKHRVTTVLPQRVPQKGNLSYSGVGDFILLHPAMTAFFLGQLRLAILLTGAGKADVIRKKVPAVRLRRALRNGDRTECVALLKKVAEWNQRSESGEWVFNKRSGRYAHLLNYFSKGGNAVTLFGENEFKNWRLGTLGYLDFHRLGFHDHMRREGKKLTSSPRARGRVTK